MSGRLTASSADADFLSADHLKVSEGDVLIAEPLINATISVSNSTLSDEELIKNKKKDEMKKRREIINLWPEGKIIYNFHPSISKLINHLITWIIN